MMGHEEMTTNAVFRFHCLGRRKFSTVPIKLVSWQIKGLDCHCCRADERNERKGHWEAHRTASFGVFQRLSLDRSVVAPADEQIALWTTAPLV
jgi:hypothetical protein